MVSVLDRDVFVVDSGGEDKPVLLLVHGFPTASFDFHRVFEELAAGHRVIAHDQLGFGYSDKPRLYSYSLIEQAELAEALWRKLGVARAHLLGHDYGTSVVTELLARRERGFGQIPFSSVVLCNGSVHLDLARLRLTQRVLKNPWAGPVLARLAGPAFFRRRLRALWGRPELADATDLSALWLLLDHNGGRFRLPALSGYLDERVRFRRRWVGALERLDLPALVLWGRKDPIAVPAIADALAGEIPGAARIWLREVGHFPMLEAPSEWSAALRRFLVSVDAR